MSRTKPVMYKVYDMWHVTPSTLYAKRILPSPQLNIVSYCPSSTYKVHFCICFLCILLTYLALDSHKAFELIFLFIPPWPLPLIWFPSYICVYACISLSMASCPDCAKERQHCNICHKWVTIEHVYQGGMYGHHKLIMWLLKRRQRVESIEPSAAFAQDGTYDF